MPEPTVVNTPASAETPARDPASSEIQRLQAEVSEVELEVEELEFQVEELREQIEELEGETRRAQGRARRGRRGRGRGGAMSAPTWITATAAGRRQASVVRLATA